MPDLWLFFDKKKMSLGRQYSFDGTAPWFDLSFKLKLNSFSYDSYQNPVF